MLPVIKLHLNAWRQHCASGPLKKAAMVSVAAIAQTLLTVLRPGDVLLMTDNAYEPSRVMGRGLLAEFGIETRWFDATDMAGFVAAICPRTKAVLMESPGSLTMEVQDIPATSDLIGVRK